MTLVKAKFFIRSNIARGRAYLEIGTKDSGDSGMALTKQQVFDFLVAFLEAGDNLTITEDRAEETLTLAAVIPGTISDTVARDGVAKNAAEILKKVTQEQVNDSLNTFYQNGFYDYVKSAPANADNQGRRIYPPSDFIAPDAEDNEILEAFQNGTKMRWVPKPQTTSGSGKDDLARDAASRAQLAADANQEEIDRLRQKTADIHVLRDEVEYQDYIMADVVFTQYPSSSAIGQAILNNRTYNPNNAGSAQWRGSGTVAPDSVVIVRARHTLDAFDFSFLLGSAHRDLEDGSLVGSDPGWEYFFVGSTGSNGLSSRIQRKTHRTHTEWDGELDGPAKDKLDEIDNYPLFADINIVPTGIPGSTLPDFIEVFLGGRLRPGEITAVRLNFNGFADFALNDSGDLAGVPEIQDGENVLRFTTPTGNTRETIENNLQSATGTAVVDIYFTVDGTPVRHRVRFPVNDENFERNNDETARDAAAAAQAKADENSSRIPAAPMVLQAAVDGGDTAGVASITLPENYANWNNLSIDMYETDRSGDRISEADFHTVVLKAQTGNRILIVEGQAGASGTGGAHYVTWNPTTRAITAAGGDRIIFAELHD